MEKMAKGTSLGLCIVLILSLGLNGNSVLARTGASDDEKPFRLSTRAMESPIGFIAGDISGQNSIAINGQRVYGAQPLWSGDLVQTLSSPSVQLSLPSLGQVALAKGTTVRLAASNAVTAEANSTRRLIASLSAGEMVVKLEERTGAYIETRGSVYTTSDGANFRFHAREGQPTFVAMKGEVVLEKPSGQKKYSLRPVGHGNKMEIYKGDLQQIRIQFIDDKNRLMAEVPVMFSMGPSDGTRLGHLGLGALAGTSFRTLTNAQGIAYVPFTAGRKEGTVSITAVAEDTGDTWSGEIEIDSDNRASKAGWIALAVAGAVVGTIVIVKLVRENDPIQTLPPTTFP